MDYQYQGSASRAEPSTKTAQPLMFGQVVVSNQRMEQKKIRELRGSGRGAR